MHAGQTRQYFLAYSDRRVDSFGSFVGGVLLTCRLLFLFSNAAL